MQVNSCQHHQYTMTYSTQIIRDVWTQVPFGQGQTKKLFKWYEAGLLGCGVNSIPWINLESYIKWPDNLDNIVDEINLALDQAGPIPGGGSCLLPKKLNGYEFLTYYQYFHEEFVPNVTEFKNQQEYDKWVMNNLSKPIWQTVLMAKQQVDRSQYWIGKHTPGAVWQVNLPLTRSWIDNLETYLFKYIGRVVIYRGKAIPIHRDYPITEHSAHFVNLQITSSNRLAFVYDEVTKEKIYTKSKAYMFNESDCHGVEDSGGEHFTVRVDGTFRDSIAEKLNLINGMVFSKDSASYSKLKNLKIFEPML